MVIDLNCNEVTAIVATGTDSVRTGFSPGCDWREAMRSAIRDAATLCRTLELPDRFLDSAQRASRDFGVFAPLGYVSRMRVGDPADPLLRQVLPLEEELIATPGFRSDPVEDRQATLLPGMLQKYQGRVLLVTTGTCAIHCRYCFRREYPYSEGQLGGDRWAAPLQRIAEDSSIEEVLLSGGDPLTLPDSTLSDLLTRLGAIPHLRRVRIHTRLPIVIPQRVTRELVGMLGESNLTPILVVHANHAAELSVEVAEAMEHLMGGGVPLLNQSVLLRGVNDSVTALADLSRRLIDLRVMPYYLHQLDPVSGAAHFQVPIATGRQLVRDLRAILPGYAVPRYAREVPGEPAKQILE